MWHGPTEPEDLVDSENMKYKASSELEWIEI